MTISQQQPQSLSAEQILAPRNPITHTSCCVGCLELIPFYEFDSNDGMCDDCAAERADTGVVAGRYGKPNASCAFRPIDMGLGR